MIALHRSEDDAQVGVISPDELRFLVDCLEEEDAEDTDYYLDRDTLEFLRGRGASPHLMRVLEGAMEDREEVEVYYILEEAAEEADALQA